ncbi:MAG TPA: biopolymer transporter ExbD [Planctomycetota bacterium]
MSTRRRAPDEVAAEQLNMTPMIDVVFQLLIFFMLTMHFQEVEGKMLSQLPKDKGLPDRQSKITEEVRLSVRAGRLYVEKHEIGELASTETAPTRGTSNKAVYAAAAAKTRGLVDVLGEASVILDAEGETAYEHVIGIIDACKVARIDHVEFVGNPKFERYYKR